MQLFLQADINSSSSARAGLKLSSRLISYPFSARESVLREGSPKQMRKCICVTSSRSSHLVSKRFSCQPKGHPKSDLFHEVPSPNTELLQHFVSLQGEYYTLSSSVIHVSLIFPNRLYKPGTLKFSPLNPPNAQCTQQAFSEYLANTQMIPTFIIVLQFQGGVFCIFATFYVLCDHLCSNSVIFNQSLKNAIKNTHRAFLLP